MAPLRLIATCTAGLEEVVKRELQNLGYGELQVEKGRISFWGEKKDIPRCNLWLRSADRILFQMGRLFVPSFDTLYEGIRDLSWEEILPKNATFPVIVKTTRSQLKSPSACQSVAKKAVVDSLARHYQSEWFREDGPLFKILIFIEKDEALVALDTTGAGLHKRGYRIQGGEAPLQETLAAGLIYLSAWKGERYLLDPFCGSGTIPIEAALIYYNLAPGLKRTFVSMDWPFLPTSLWKEGREEALAGAKKTHPPQITGRDISEKAIERATFHARKAGVSKAISFQVAPFARDLFQEEYGALITNPPYGERQQDRRQVEDLYRLMGRTLQPVKTWSFYILSAHKNFEGLFASQATRRRKLYNGGLPCQFYQYHGPRPGGHHHV